MRNLEEIKNDLAEKNRQIGEIEGQIVEAEKILSEQKNAYSKALLAKADPETLTDRRNAIHSANIEADGVMGVKEILQAELLELETEAAAAQLYATDAEKHNNSMAQVERSVTAINEGLPKLETLVNELSSAIMSLIR